MLFVSTSRFWFAHRYASQRDQWGKRFGLYYVQIPLRGKATVERLKIKHRPERWLSGQQSLGLTWTPESPWDPHCRRRTDCHELSVDLHRCAIASTHSKDVCMCTYTHTHARTKKNLLFATENKSEARSLSRARLSGIMPAYCLGTGSWVCHQACKNTSF